MFSRFFSTSIRALLAVGLCAAGHAAITYNSVVWSADTVADGAGTGTLVGNTVSYSSAVVANSGITFDTSAFPPNWNASPATNGGGTLAYTSTLAGVLGTPGAAALQTITFSTTVTNPILLVNFAAASTQISIGASLTVLSSNNCTLTGFTFTCAGATRTASDGFAVQINATFGPGVPLLFTYADTGGANTIGFSIADLLAPSVAKTFSPASIPIGGTSTVTVTITNPNPVALTGVAFSDTLPAGMVFASPSGLGQTCGGVAVAATGPPAVLSLSGGTLAANGTCTVTANVTASTAGQRTNSVQVTATGTPASNTSTATLGTFAPPVLTKTFADPMLTFSPVTKLTFTVTNPNSFGALTGIGFTDTLPAGLTVNTPNGLTGSCDGGTISAVAGSSTISLSGATLAASASCTFSVDVIGAIGSDGTLTNTTSTVSSVEGGPGTGAAASIIDNQYILFLWWFS